MARSFSELSVFISAPTSMDAERRLVATIVESLPKALLDRLGVRFGTISWEDDVIPGIGVDGQSVINDQLRDAYDIYIGLLGAQFGTATPRAGSGTEEEFDLAYSKYCSNPSSVRVLFYFKKLTDDIFRLDLEQLTKVKAFREKLKQSGVLFHDFSNGDALTKALTAHLENLVERQWQGNGWQQLEIPPQALAQRSQPAIPSADSLVHEPQSPLFAEQDQDMDDEPGLLDFLVLGSEATPQLMQLLQKIAGHSVRFSGEIESLAATGGESEKTPQQLKWAVDELANILREYARNLAADLPTFEALTTQVINTMAAFVEAQSREAVFVDTIRKSMPSALSSLSEGMLVARIGLSSLRENINGTPGYTSRLKKAQRMAVQGMDAYIAYMTVALGKLETLQQASATTSRTGA